MDDRAAVADCTDLIDHWMLKEQVPADAQLLSAYHAKGATAYYWRAQSYVLLREYGLAIHDYSESIRLSKMVAEPFSISRTALVGRGEAYITAGLYDLAIADYSSLLKTDRDEFSRSYSLWRRGEAYLQKDAYSQALSDFDAALAASPTFYAIHLARARLNIAMNHPELAVADCTTAITLYPKGAEAYMRRGIAYWFRGLALPAEEDLTKAISLGDAEILSFYFRAAVRKYEGRGAEALADWQKVIELSADTQFERELQQKATLEVKNFMH
jgi:tetratricopeptide (TPR) repeat protein